MSQGSNMVTSTQHLEEMDSSTSVGASSTTNSGIVETSNVSTINKAETAPPSTQKQGHGNHTVVLHGDSSYAVKDVGPDRDVAANPAKSDDKEASVLNFSDGVGVVDATGVTEDVFRLYQAAFNRPADLGGLQLFSNAVHAGALTLDGVAEQLTHQPEFISKNDVGSSSGYVQALYRNVLGRDGDAQGIDQWTRALDNGGYSKAKVLRSFAQSDENLTRTLPVAGSKDESQIARLYQAAFNREPDVDGLRASTKALHNGLSASKIADNLIASDEAARAGLSSQDFVSHLYENVLHRAPDAAGAAQWQKALDSGMSKGDVLLGFSDSNENRELTASSTHDGWVFLGK